MKNNVVLKVNGNNINRFIRRLIKNKIQVYDLDRISNKEIIITISTKDLEEIDKFRGLYQINIIRYIGKINAKNIFKHNFVMYLCLTISLTIILILSNFIYEIKIYHTNSTLKTTLLNELKSYGIRVGAYKKDFKQIEEIKNQILEKYKNDIEWLEITRVGTMYEIRLEERIINNTKKEDFPQDIIAKKSGVIKKIYSSNGTILKNENEYVSKGDVIVSGSIYLNEQLKGMVHANAKVFAETWYTVKINFPLYYREETYTKNKKNLLNISFLDKDYNIFNFKKYKNYNKKDNILYQSKLLPLKITWQEQKEINLIENIYNPETAQNKAIEYASKQIEKNLSEEEYIIDKKVLKNEQKDSTIYMEIFFKIYEDITDTRKTEIPEENYD